MEPNQVNGHQNGETRPKKILIVEDERIIALDLKKRLERFGFYAPEIVSDGESAITTATSLRPDIILMDIMLGGQIDGIEAAKTIKDTLNIPVIFLTAYSNENTLDRAKEAEPYGYILKPFKERELYTTIDISLYKFEINRKLQQQERWLSAVLHSVEDGIIATDKNSRIDFMNPVAETITGWNEEEAKGHFLNEVFAATYGRDQRPLILPELNVENPKDPPFVFSNCVLTNKKSARVHIDGSFGVIRDRKGVVEGQVLAFRDTTEMQRLSDTINYQASHDTLTGLANRDEFSSRLEYALEAAREQNEVHSLLYLDVDQFRVVNDICGHTAGDELLLKTTKIIRSVIRSSDFSARLGGDEFGILLEEASTDRAIEIAKRLQSRLMEDKLVWKKNVFNISTSIGIVPIDYNSESVHSILAAADDACYLAKDEGGNKYKVYQQNESRFVQRRGEMQWISHLTQALEEDRFVLYHQPIVSLDESTSHGKKSEILVRMIDKENNLIMPEDFIPAAERYNLMPSIDRWVIQTSFENFKTLDEKYNGAKNPFSFTINLSAAFLADETSLDFLDYQLREYQVPPEAFCFEITETAAITNMESATRFLHEVQSIGISFALDDFGSGFSSFNYLRQLPVNYLKIDGIFVKNLHEDHISRAMVEAINSLGHFMGIKTIAEFVTNDTIMDNLKSIGVDFAQGYHVGVPRPFHELLTEADSVKKA
ncbi:MAG TPA: GGDEF domain-containing response regulator [Sediminispirochaeta sp.]|nr:GGDEF domain-containing response regulator [Sediminispirochaeta sp.]